MNKSGLFRKKKACFTMVSNNILRDNTVSLKAKGLYSLIQSYLTLEDFVLYKNFLKKQCKEKESSFSSAWKELKDCGYLVQYKCRDKKTNRFYYEYELLDDKKPHPDFPGVENPCGGKRGVYNNTNYNNTNYNNTNLQFIDKIDIWEDEVAEYVGSFLCIRNRYINKRHKRISNKNIHVIQEYIKSVINSEIYLDVFEDVVEEYFKKLSKQNDGDILCFMSTAKKRKLL